MCACALLDATVRQFRPGSRQRASEVNACRPPHRPEQSEVGGPSGRACVHRRPVVVLGDDRRGSFSVYASMVAFSIHGH